MGISGAAAATAISQFVGCGILLFPFLRERTITRLDIGKRSRSVDTYLLIVKFGLPSFCRQGLASVSSVALNVSAAVYGDAAVAAMTIVAKIFMFVFSLILGIGQGYMPVLGFNYGAREFGRVRKAFFFTFRTSVVLMTSFAAAGFFAAENLMAVFIANDPDVVRTGALALRAQCLAMPLMPLGVMCNMSFQSIGKAWTATLLAVSRQGIFFLPLILLLPRRAGLLGVQTTQPLADLCTFLFCIPFAVHFFRHIRRETARSIEI
jgi:Na+-driven multidrug efflux pump